MQIGIIGGGQLAMMLVEACSKRNIDCVVLDPNPKCSASHVCNNIIVADYDNKEALNELSKRVDIITYEFENINLDVIRENDKVLQGVKPLYIASSRNIEKQYAIKSNLNPVPFSSVESIDDIKTFIDKYDLPIILKTNQFGYDGKGQYVLNNIDNLNTCEDFLKNPCILEKMIDIDYEFSIITFRNKRGDITFLPSTKNVHINSILHTSECSTDFKLDDLLYSKVKDFLEINDLYGIITIEFFVDTVGNIYFNEMAPRPHNSGHYSIEGCSKSQYDLLIDSLTNINFEEIKYYDTFMVNVLGQDYDRFIEYMKSNSNPNIYFHDYYKDEKRINRKVGHITAVGKDAISEIKKLYLGE